MPKKILITGGHITPALALAEELIARGWTNLVFIGRRHAFEGDSAISYEQAEIQARGIRFLPLKTGRLTRYLGLLSLISLLKIPYGVLRSFFLVKKEKPQLIISFGGYVAFPIVVAGFISGIPIVSHEQTLKPGLTNKILAYLSARVCVSWTKTLTEFPKEKVILTGNPLRRDLFKNPAKDPIQITTRPLLCFAGGSAGSHTINMTVKKLIRQLVKSYTVIHQTGNSKLTNDYHILQETREMLTDQEKKQYYPVPFLTAQELGWVYRHGDLFISRAGANTVYEIATFGIPAILIPLPWSGMGEQQANAEFLERLGLAKIIDQERLDSRLSEVIRYMLEHSHEFKKHASGVQNYIDGKATTKLADVVETFLTS